MQTALNINYVFSLVFALNALAFSLFLQGKGEKEYWSEGEK